MRPRRTGNALVKLLVVVLVIFLPVGILGLLGSQAEGRLTQALDEGLNQVNLDRGELAFNQFSKAKEEFGFPLKSYRLLAGLTGKTFRTPEEIDQLVVSALLLKAYADLFEMKSVATWVGKAEIACKNIPGPEGAELMRSVVSARDLSNLCVAFEAGQYEEAMKGLLKAEKNAQPTDSDFFVMEVRMMIACGKALQEPAVLDKARELLQFLSSEVGIKGPKIDRLWGLLNR